MKHGFILAALAASGIWSLQAQEQRYELGVSATGNFLKQSVGNGLTHATDDKAGVGASFRYWITKRQGLDVSWSNFSAFNSYQQDGAGTYAAFKNRTNEATMSYVYRLPTFSSKIQPFVMAGGGALVISQYGPGGVYNTSTIARPTFTYGGGVDAYLSRHIGLRAQYKGFVLSDPDQGLDVFKTGSTTHLAQPSAGVFWRF